MGSALFEMAVQTGSEPRNARAAFGSVSHRWALSEREVARVLGLLQGSVEACASGATRSCELPAEIVTKLLTILEIDNLLSLTSIDPANLPLWLRTSHPAFDGRSPIEQLSRSALDASELRDLLHLESRLPSRKAGSLRPRIDPPINPLEAGRPLVRWSQDGTDEANL